jgi:hypothetical protein
MILSTMHLSKLSDIRSCKVLRCLSRMWVYVVQCKTRCILSSLSDLHKRQVDETECWFHSHSWFTHIRKLLQKYNLPTAYDMMDNPPTKHQWKQLLNKAFEEHLHTEWHNNINDKPSLKYLALPKHLNKQPHQLWHSVPNVGRLYFCSNFLIWVNQLWLWWLMRAGGLAP